MTANIVPDMPNEAYHAVPALSASGAWLLAQECPAIYWHGSPFNPDAAPQESNAAMDTGTALHLAMLEPGRLADNIAVIDAEDWRRLDERALAWGRQMIRRSLELFRRCRDTGLWPAYSPEPTTLSLPAWGEYQLADREQAGDFSAEAAERLIRAGMELYAP